jgi:hypothetical protein
VAVTEQSSGGSHCQWPPDGMPGHAQLTKHMFKSGFASPSLQYFALRLKRQSELWATGLNTTMHWVKRRLTARR